MRGFFSGRKCPSQSETLPPKAATPRRISSSRSPSRYSRSSILLQPSRPRPDSIGRSRLRLHASLLALLYRPFVLDRFGHPAAPLRRPPLVDDAAPERRVGGEPRVVRAGQVLAPLPLHPGFELLVVGELLLVAQLLPSEEPRSLVGIGEPDRVCFQHQLVPRRLGHRRLDDPLLQNSQPLGRDLVDLLVRALLLLDHAVHHVATLLESR